MLLSARCDIAMSTQILVAYRSLILTVTLFLSGVRWEQEMVSLQSPQYLQPGPAKTSKGAILVSESL